MYLEFGVSYAQLNRGFADLNRSLAICGLLKPIMGVHWA